MLDRGGVERVAEDFVIVIDQLRKQLAAEAHALFGQLNRDAAAVIPRRYSLRQSAGFEPVENSRNAAHGDQGRTHVHFHLPDEVFGTSHVSQNFASFAAELSDPVKAAYPSGRTKMIKGEAPKYFSNLSLPGMAAISCPRII